MKLSSNASKALIYISPHPHICQDCGQTCQCQTNGTILCSPIDGGCFCKENYFGDYCQLECPFGYSEERLECLAPNRKSDSDTPALGKF